MSARLGWHSKDADLIGIPIRVVIGKVWQREGKFEPTVRAPKATTTVAEAELVEAVKASLT